MTPSDIVAADSAARRTFIYLSDTVDTWRSHADEALAGAPWYGDCDDLGSTALEILARGGAALSDLYRLTVLGSSDGAGHFVGCVRDDDGNWWIVGDTYFPAYPASDMAHKPNLYNRLSEAGPGVEPLWRVGVPWLAAAQVTR